MQIRKETADDWWEVEALFDLSFAPGREALSSYRLRDGVDPVPELCLVARDDDGVLGGAIRFWPICTRLGNLPTFSNRPMCCREYGCISLSCFHPIIRITRTPK